MSGAGLADLNGFYRRPGGWDGEDAADAEAQPEGAAPTAEDAGLESVRFDSMRQLVQQQARQAFKPYSFALAWGMGVSWCVCVRTCGQ